MKWRKPANGMVVGGVDLFDRFGMVMTDDMELGVPAPKSYSVDVPGGDGALDVTEALTGDVAFSNRVQRFEFLVPDPADFERTKTEVANMLNGRRLEYELTFDPGYTYAGRFEVESWRSSARYGTVSVRVDADPYKLKRHESVRVAAGGGAVAVLVCGRRRQRPVFECSRECVVVAGGVEARLQPGRWRVSGLWLTEGENEVFVDTAPGGGDRPMSEIAGNAVSSMAAERVSALSWRERPPDTDDLAVTVEYDVMDL